MHFDQVLEQATADRIRIPKGWMQGRAFFGGLLAALLYQRMTVDAPEVPVRSVMVSFVGPVVPGEAELRAEVLRRGSSVTQMEARLLQDGETRAVMLAAFGAGRESVIERMPESLTSMAGPDQGMPMPEVPGVVPEFTQHFDFRWTEGDAPFSGRGDGRIGGWVRLREPPAVHDAAHILGLVDAWPPATLPMYPRPAPGSSLTWSLEFLRHEFPSPAWWQYRARTDAAGEGYAHTEAWLADEQGVPVALSRQSVVMFI